MGEHKISNCCFAPADELVSAIDEDKRIAREQLAKEDVNLYATNDFFKVQYDHEPVANAVAKFAAFRSALGARADCADYGAKLDQAMDVIERVLLEYP
jgi:hypothetical protein